MKKYLLYIIFFLIQNCVFTQNLVPFLRKNGKYILVEESTKKPILQTEYDSIGFFNDGLSIVKKDGKYGYINSIGDIQVPISFENLSLFNEGRAKFSIKINGDVKYGFIDTNGNIIVQPKYSIVHDFKNGRALVGKNVTETKFGMAYDKKGYIIDSLYSAIGFIDYNGNEVVPLKYSPHYIDLSDFGKIQKDLSLMIRQEGDYPYHYNAPYITVFIDKNGNEVKVIDKDKTIVKYMNGLFVIARYKKGGKKATYGLMDSNGKVILEPLYDKDIGFSENLISRNDLKSKKWGYTDTSGNVVIPFEYIKAFPFKTDYAMIVKKEGLGLINKKGEILFPIQQGKNYYHYYDDIFVVEVYNKNEIKYGLMSSQNIILIPIEYEKIEYMPFHKIFGVKKDGKWGIYDVANSRFLLPLQYDDYLPFNKNGFARVSNNGKSYYIDINGNEYVE